MPYDFSQLNDKEFEAIVTDLLSLEFKTRIERFKPGKDQGVDGRFFAKDGREHIIQCKHYVKSGYSKLLRVLKNTESKKVQALDPKAYYLATSVPLSRKQKRDIQQIFTPYIRQADHVFGPDDLNQLLETYGEIEKTYYKLWLASSNVMVTLLNQAIEGRSKYELERIRSKSKIFVETKDFYTAMKKLNEKRVVILSGEPGIGKTTLADNLCLAYASNGYEFVFIEESVSEAEAVFQLDKRQVFYYDDFLGSNYLEAIEGKRDSHIIHFIERVKQDQRKRFILTSRTNIFLQGVQCSPVLSNRNIKAMELLLDIKQHTEYDKAKILYNHLWFGNLSEAYIDEIYQSKRYKEVIRHRNYNPRLIEFITDPDRIVDVVPGDYWQYIVLTMDNPRDVWENCFKYQSNQQVRALVTLTVANGGEIKEEDIRKGYKRLQTIENIESNTNTEMNFNTACSIAIKSFLNRNQKYSRYYLQLFNPSISDYVICEYKNSPEKFKNAFCALDTMASLNQLESMIKRGLITLSEHELSSLFRDSITSGKSTDYQLKIAEILPREEILVNERVELLRRVLHESADSINNYSSLFRLLNTYWGKEGLDRPEPIGNLISEEYLDEEDMQCLLEMINNHSLDISSYREEIENMIEYHAQEEIRSKIPQEDISDLYSSELDNYGDLHLVFNNDRVVDMAIAVADELLESFNLDRVPVLDVSMERILEGIDLEDLCPMPKYDYDDSWEPSERESYDSDIDDLFERT